MDVIQNFSHEITLISLTMTIVTALVHVIFAGAVAKDAGCLNQQGHPVFLVSGIAWAFATLVGGVFVAVLYWVLHHSTLCKT